MTSPVQPIPDAWRQDVLRILRRGDPKRIEWTFQAGLDWGQFGFESDAYQHLLKALSVTGSLGRQVSGMVGAEEIWEFLCPHPLGAPKPLYAKIGILKNRLSIKIFSIHIDRKGALESAIAAWVKKLPPHK